MLSPLARRLIIIAGVVSAAAWLLLLALAPPAAIPWSAEMREAASRADAALQAVARQAAAAGAMAPPGMDPLRTGVIGPEWSELVTTAGQLPAKRTSANPDIAALILHLLRRAGLEQGDVVAIGASASFPALVLSSVAAAEAAGAQAVVIISLGSSAYGASNPEFDLLHMYEAALAAGAVRTAPAAVSLGGRGDNGADMEPVVRERLARRIETAGMPLLLEPDLERSVARRMQIYAAAAAGRPAVAAYINIGGNDASIGRDATILQRRPGLAAAPRAAPGHRGGVIAGMDALGVPVIHLLNIRGLADRYGLPWDPPVPPRPGSTHLADPDGTSPRGHLLLLVTAYFAVLALLAGAGARPGRHRHRQDPDAP
jgi:poly-gamma-glutamate system protein